MENCSIGKFFEWIHEQRLVASTARMFHWSRLFWWWAAYIVWLLPWASDPSANRSAINAHVVYTNKYETNIAEVSKKLVELIVMLLINFRWFPSKYGLLQRHFSLHLKACLVSIYVCRNENSKKQFYLNPKDIRQYLYCLRPKTADYSLNYYRFFFLLSSSPVFFKHFHSEGHWCKLLKFCLQWLLIFIIV